MFKSLLKADVAQPKMLLTATGPTHRKQQHALEADDAVNEGPTTCGTRDHG